MGLQMKKTDQSLIEQLRITQSEIDKRKALYDITTEDIDCLQKTGQLINQKLENLVCEFYEIQTAIPEVVRLIGDSETLKRLHVMLKRYLLDLFSGDYDSDYVNNRLRIGLVHKHIGVDPKYYLAAVRILQNLLYCLIRQSIPEPDQQNRIICSLQKLIMFDIAFVFDTYIHSMLEEIEDAKRKSDLYAQELEEKVRERTRQLEMLSRTDPLTGLLNMRHFSEIMNNALHAAERRREPVTVAYVDINDFKTINDTHGHQHGDSILQLVSKAIKAATRTEDYSFRYGGDEFCIVMSNCRLDYARGIWGKRVRDHIQEQEPELQLSIGYAQTGPDSFISSEQLIQLADERMYENKKLLKGGKS